MAELVPSGLLLGDRRVPVWLAFAADGKTLAARYSDSTPFGFDDMPDELVVWDATDWRERRRGPVAAVRTGQFSSGPTGALAIGDRCLVPTPDGVEAVVPAPKIGRVKTAGRGRDRFIWLTGDGTTAAALSRGVRLHLDAVTLTPPVAASRLLELELPTNSDHADDLRWTAAAVDPSARWLAVTGNHFGQPRDAYRVDIWDVRERKRVAQAAGHGHGASCLAFSPDGKLLASGAGDGSVRLWDVPGGTERAVLTGPKFTVSQLAFSADCRRLVYGTLDGRDSPNLWVADPTAGKLVARLATGSAGAIQLAVSPDGRSAAVSGLDATIRVLSLDRIADARP